MFTSVLIANRGEIALRVARACRELGMRVVAVHSTEDRRSAVVRFADESVQIGPAAARHSPLDMPAVVGTALRTGVEAIHPGYGFLPEDPDFAEVCEANGTAFVGLPAEAMRKLGDKSSVRAIMAGAGLPLLPGSVAPLPTVEEARAVAEDIGYPVIIKAVAGCGGRGMSVVRRGEDFDRAYAETRASARSLFGDGRVYVERYLDLARHVEIQVLCDKFGNGVHLGERDCSVQRRHQQLIEETPAPGLSRDKAGEMGAAAVRGALAAGHVGAGTFEFLVDREGDYYFMAVNGRIQVEHPATELVTGIDLIHEQFRAAAGKPLAIRQEDVHPRGAAIECRVHVEDPARGFVPTPGVLEVFEPPEGAFVRVDTHGYPGCTVSPAYDSLLARLVVWAPDREQALERMRRALAEFRVSGPGVCTTIGFQREVLAHPLFRDGEHDTSLVGGLLERRSQDRAA